MEEIIIMVAEEEGIIVENGTCLNLDSINMISMIIHLEDQFDIVFTEDDFVLIDFHSIAGIAEAIEERLEERRGQL